MFQFLASIMEVKIDNCHENPISAGILILDVVGKFHPKMNAALTSPRQFQLDITTSGDDVVAVWQNRGLSAGRSVYKDIGLFDIIKELAQPLRMVMPKLGHRQFIAKGKKSCRTL